MAKQSEQGANQEPFNQADKNLTDTVLTQVHEGYKVFDRNGKEVGKVDQVYFGEVNEKLDAQGQGAATAREPRNPQTNATVAVNPNQPGPIVLGNIGGTVNSGDLERFPHVVRARLLRLGFIRIGGGLFHGPRYVPPEQIANVQGDRVNLTITKDELIKP